MPSFASLLKAASPFKSQPDPNKGKALIPISGGVRPLDVGTLAEQYMSSGYSEVGNQFGPGTPPLPQPMDSTGQPRRWQYPPGIDLIRQPNEGRVDFALVQALVDNYDLFRQAIYIRIDEIACMDFDIVPDPLVARSVKDKRDLQNKYKDNIWAARQFFKKPDKVNVFQIWIRNLLEDHFMYDCMTLYKRRTRGDALYSLEYLDGTIIKPLVNVSGRLPDPPETSYQQYIFGKPVFDFTRDELIYAPKNVRPRSMYGFSIVEQFMLHINLALRFQTWNTAFFTDGNIPSRLLTAPDNWTADKIEEWQQLFDAIIAGDPAAQRKLFMVPPGVAELGGGNEGMFQYALEFSNYLIDITCVATGVTRQELGLEPANSEGLGGSGLHDAMESVHNRRLVRLADFLADVIFTPILQEEFDLPHFVWSWPDLEMTDPAAHAELNEKLLFTGQKSLDEVYMEQGLDPVGIERFMVIEGKPLFIKDLLRMQEEGTLAMEEKQLAQQQSAEMQNQQQLAEHSAGLQQQTAEHQAGLQQQQAEQQFGFEQQKAEHQMGLQQQTAEHGAGLQQQQAANQAELDKGKMDHQGEIQQGAQQEQAMMSQQQLEQQSLIQAQQAATQHQYTMQKAQEAQNFARQKALIDYHTRLGLPLDPSLLQAAPQAMAGGQSTEAQGQMHPDSLFNPNNPQGLYSNYQPQIASSIPSDPANTMPIDEQLTKAAVSDEQKAREELEQWHRKVQKAAKAGKHPSKVKFTPNYLSPLLAAQVERALEQLADNGSGPIKLTFKTFDTSLGLTPYNLEGPFNHATKEHVCALCSSTGCKCDEDCEHEGCGCKH